MVIKIFKRRIIRNGYTMQKYFSKQDFIQMLADQGIPEMEFLDNPFKPKKAGGGIIKTSWG